MITLVDIYSHYFDVVKIINKVLISNYKKEKRRISDFFPFARQGSFLRIYVVIILAFDTPK